MKIDKESDLQLKISPTMKSKFRFSYLLKTLLLTAIILSGLIKLAIYIDINYGFLSSKAVILYVALIAGVLSLLIIWNDFITLEINKEKILFGAPFKKKKQLLIKDIEKVRTFYIKHSNTSSQNGIEAIDGFKTLGLIIKDASEIQIQGSVYSNFTDLEEYIKKLKEEL